MKNIDWKKVGVAFSSLLAMLAIAPYTLGELGEIIPPKWKAKLTVVALTASFLLRIWNSKQKPQEPQPPTTPTP